MSHVTVPTELESLRAELAEWVRWRNANLDYAERLVRNTNKNFDAIALELNRRIKKLTPVPEPEPTTKRAKPVARITTDMGFTQEEVDHYNELAGKVKR